jgi:hypothetical protein
MWFTSLRLSVSLALAGHRAVWQCRVAPPLSRLLPALPCASRVRLPSASPSSCDRPERRVSHPPSVTGPCPATRQPPGRARQLVPPLTWSTLRPLACPASAKRQVEGGHRQVVGMTIADAKDLASDQPASSSLRRACGQGRSCAHCPAYERAGLFTVTIRSLLTSDVTEFKKTTNIVAA